MKTTEYSQAKNITHIQNALHSVRNIIPSHSKFDSAEYQQVMEWLYVWQDQMIEDLVVEDDYTLEDALNDLEDIQLIDMTYEEAATSKREISEIFRKLSGVSE